MTVPLRRILLDPDLPRKIPRYVSNFAARQRKRVLTALFARFAPDRLLLDTEAFVDWDAAPFTNEYPLINHSVAGLRGLTVVTPETTYPATDDTTRDVLRSAGLPDTQVRSALSFVADLSDVTIHSDSGVICTERMRLLEDSALGHRETTLSSAYGEPRRRAPYLPGTYSSIWGRHGDNHYHWLVEELPRLYSLASFTDEPVTLLMPETLSREYRKSLGWCSPPNVTIQFLPPRSWWRTERFLFPSYTVYKEFSVPAQPHLRYVRDKILRACELSAPGSVGEKLIYVSRQGAPFRRLTNEDAIIKVLETFGFQPYRLEDLSFEEQVHLFHDAACIVGPHGAGLANALFAGPVPLIELIPLHMPASYYYMLTFALGQTYACVRSEPDPRVRDHRTARLTDFGVSLDRLRSVLHTVLEVAPLGPK